MIREQIAETIKNEAYCGYEGKLLGRRDAANAILTLLCTEIEKMGVKLTALPDKVYENEPHPLETKAGYLAGWNDGTEAQLQKILNKLKEGAE